MKPISASHFTRMMKSEARLHVNWVLGSSFSGAQSGGCRAGRIDHSPMFSKTRLRDVDLAAKFSLRQGLWIEN